MVKLITTDTQYNILPILLGQIENVNELSVNNLIFCEEKISLMTEFAIANKFGGSFNTKVYSFGNFLRAKRQFDKLLSKEGSSMAIKKVLSSLNLKKFKSTTSIAPAIYELIAQLKSARIDVQTLEDSLLDARGILKEKLTDICEIYKSYEKFLNDFGYEDQSSCLNYLPELIKNDNSLCNTNVFIIGFTGFTAQQRQAIGELIKCAKSVTAILIKGENHFAYVNETCEVFNAICDDLRVKCSTKHIETACLNESKKISQGLFNPVCYKTDKISTDKIFYSTFPSRLEEIENVVGIIKTKVINGECRYKDVCIAIPEGGEYDDVIKSTMEMFEVPYFYDKKQIPISHPLVSLIVSYVDLMRKGFDGETFRRFYKNPLVFHDKKLVDSFENYTLMFNVKYSGFKKPFTYNDERNTFDLEKLEEFRKYLIEITQDFNVFKLLTKLDVENKLQTMGEELEKLGFRTESEINAQIYQAILGILNEMQMVLNDSKISLLEYKTLFLSGVLALELSVIPQYNDAVFIGDFKQVGLTNNKFLFAVGLTSSVPNVKEDVALLSDSDIDQLKKIKVLVEPKIRIVNHRMRESVTLALSSFYGELYLSHPISGEDGKTFAKSPIITYVGNMFDVKNFPKVSRFLTKKQASLNFSRECVLFCHGKTSDNSFISTYYDVNGKKDKTFLASTEKLKVSLEKNQKAVLSNLTSPTAIEDYFKCPYRSFLVHGLKISERKIGDTNRLSVGNLMHEIFSEFVKNIDSVNDDNLSKVIDDVILQVNNKNSYAILNEDKESALSYERVKEEGKKYCHKIYELFKNSQFRTSSDDVEVKFGKGGKYPEISLSNGKVKLTGKIDRLDTCDDYFRVLDYKTGNVDDKDKALFVGEKLQLFLYAGAIPDKKLAGVYYLPVSDNFKRFDEDEELIAKGKTLDEKEVCLMQDNTILTGEVSKFNGIKIKDGKVVNGTSKENLTALTDYAILVSEKAVEEMSNGVIVASPYENACEYCKFRGMCKKQDQEGRKVKCVNEQVIFNAVKGAKDAQT